jgi:hypothetical protein
MCIRDRTATSVGFAVRPMQHIGVRARKQVEAEFERLGSWTGARTTSVTWSD